MPRRSPRDVTWSATERAGFIASIASIGATLEPGLLPRGAADQVIATGVVSAVNYGVVTTSQAVLRTVITGLASARGRESTVRDDYVAGLTGVAVGSLAWAFGNRGAGSAVSRALGRRLVRSCMVGLIASAAGDVSGRLQGDIAWWLLPSRRPAATVVGAGIAARAVYRQRRPPATASGTTPGRAQTIRAVLTGGCFSAGLVAVGRLDHSLAVRVSRLTETVLPPGPGARGLAAAIGHGSVLWMTLWLTRGYLRRNALTSQAEGTRIDTGYAQPPQLPVASGGPRSVVPYETLGRQGARFVHDASTASDIAEVMGGSPIDPSRAYVGLRSASTPADRAELAMRELEALGAFARATLCVAVPAGTGFVNPVAIAALEYLTGGDCATVAVQYSLRKSYHSLNRVALSAQQNRLLLAALAERVRSMPDDRRPRLLLYGESLGAFAAQDSLHADGAAALEPANIDRALFVGTPRRSGWARRWRTTQQAADRADTVIEVASHQEWSALPASSRDSARVVLLSHRDDPVTVFDGAMLVRPTGARSAVEHPGVDPIRWRPFTTFVLTAIDMKNAMAADPGRFTTTGHDYRGDLARLVSSAYRLPCDDATIERIESALRRRQIEAVQRQQGN